MRKSKARTEGFKVFAAGLLTCALLFTCSGSAPAGADKPHERYNVLLVFIDDVRADHLSCYGYKRRTSPHIDAIAAESALFEQVFSPASYTFSSFMSVITSLYANSSGMQNICKDRLSPRVRTLAEVFSAYGYTTAWFGSNGDHLTPEAGFARGFGEFRRMNTRYRQGQLAGAVIDWLHRNRGKKFFLGVHTYLVHDPYTPSPRYKRALTRVKAMKGIVETRDEFDFVSIRNLMRAPDRAKRLLGEELYGEFVAAVGPLPKNRPQILEFFGKRKKITFLSSVLRRLYWESINLADPEVNAYMQTLYDAEIMEADNELVAPITRTLKKLGLMEKTIVVIFSDHGEEFNEHGNHGHGEALYRESTHVPLIIRVPWDTRGRRVQALAQTVDIMPTLLELLAIPVPRQAQGVSLAALANGEDVSAPREYAFGRMQAHHYIRSRDWLLVSYDDGRPPELYDLARDPGERHNIYPGPDGVAAKLESLMDEWEKRLPSYRDGPFEFEAGVDEAAKERIRKTGYW